MEYKSIREVTKQGLYSCDVVSQYTPMNRLTRVNYQIYVPTTTIVLTNLSYVSYILIFTERMSAYHLRHWAMDKQTSI